MPFRNRSTPDSRTIRRRTSCPVNSNGHLPFSTVARLLLQRGCLRRYTTSPSSDKMAGLIRAGLGRSNKNRKTKSCGHYWLYQGTKPRLEALLPVRIRLIQTTAMSNATLLLVAQRLDVTASRASSLVGHVCVLVGGLSYFFLSRTCGYYPARSM